MKARRIIGIVLLLGLLAIALTLWSDWMWPALNNPT